MEEKIKVIERSEHGDSAQKIASALSVGKTQIQSIVKDEINIRTEWENCAHVDRTFVKARKTTVI